MSVFKSGFIAISGRPNMGKSTFLNQVLGQKVAIVSPKPQTTRTRILGVHHRPQSQMIFLDTPGIHEHGKNLLSRSMVRIAYHACQEADLILFFVDATHGVTDEDWRILGNLSGSSVGHPNPNAHHLKGHPDGSPPLLLIFNKVDRIDPRTVLPLMAAAHNQATQLGIGIQEMIPISALKGDNVNRLVQVIETRLPPGPSYFNEDQVTDQPERFIAAELIREKLFLFLNQELPYSVAVLVERFLEENSNRGSLIRIEAIILVERESQKGIVIGSQGSMLKRVGSEARRELESLLGTRVFLQLWVKVRPGWNEDNRTLQEMGYPLDQEDHGAS